MNPVLLKPGSDRSQPGRRARAGAGRRSARCRTGERKARAARGGHRHAWPTCGRAYDVVVCEGAGSPAEINLRADRHRQHGPGAGRGPAGGGGRRHRPRRRASRTSSARSRCCRRPTRRWSRGSWSTSSAATPALLAPGLDAAAGADRPADARACCRGADGLWLDAEDSLSAVTDGVLGRPAPPHGADVLRVAVVRFPRMSNFTDVDALAAEPGVAVRYVTEPRGVADADLVVLPGSQGDRRGPRRGCARTGLADAVVAHARGRAAGARDLRRLPDARAARSRTTYESRAGSADGLGLLPPEVALRGARRCSAEPGRARPGAAGARLRDPPRARGAVGGEPAVLDGPGEGSDAGVVSARTGTGCWRTTGSAARSCPRSPAGRPHRFRAAPGHVFAADARGAARPARRSRRGARRHRRAAAMSSVTARRRTSRR